MIGELTVHPQSPGFECPMEPFLSMRTMCRTAVLQQHHQFRLENILHEIFTGTGQTDSLGRTAFVAATIAGPVRAQNQEQAQNQDLTFSLGGIPGQTRRFQTSPSAAEISADRSFGVNYGHRFTRARIASLYGEIEFAAIPN
jgi:hypothetical protein